jgi:hypothetical protein
VGETSLLCLQFGSSAQAETCHLQPPALLHSHESNDERSGGLSSSKRVSASCVTFSMTPRTKRNQVLDHIVTELAPGYQVMDLQILHGAALLTAPRISFEHSFPDNCILLRIQSYSRSFVAEGRRVQRT